MFTYDVGYAFYLYKKGFVDNTGEGLGRARGGGRHAGVLPPDEPAAVREIRRLPFYNLKENRVNNRGTRDDDGAQI